MSISCKPITIDFEIFQEILENLQKIKKDEEEIREDKRRIEKTNLAVQSAQEVVEKAGARRDLLSKRNEFLKRTIEEAADRVNQALKYWKDYGLEIKEISTNHYEFIYTILKASVGVKLDDKQLKVVSQDPAVINSETITELNTRLTNSCVHPDGTDYKLAMLHIKKELMKKLPTSS